VIKADLSIYMPSWHRVEAEVLLYQVSTPALEGDRWSAPCPGRFTPGSLFFDELTLDRY